VGKLFEDAFLGGGKFWGINLTYLIRRGEYLPTSKTPSIDVLLEEGLRLDDSFALVNEALRRAAGIQCESDWLIADNVMSRVEDVGGVISWWRNLADTGDPEGHLVLAWLARHRGGLDNNSIKAEQRICEARIGGWKVPEWMLTSL